MPKRSDSSQTDVTALRRRAWGLWGIVVALTLVPVFVLSLLPAVPREALFAVSAILALVTVCVMVVRVPFSHVVTPRATRVVAGISGVCSIVLAGVLCSDDSDMWTRVRTWLVASVGALVVLLLAGFAFEMARRDRSRLIESLSAFVTAGVTAWAGGGWIFAADAFSMPVMRWIAAAIVIVIAVLLMVALPLRLGGDDVESAGRSQLYFLGTVPVQLAGLAVPLTVLLGIAIF